MSHQYQAIAWNHQKRVYDIVLLAGVTLYLTLFIGVSAFLFPYATAKTLFIRAAGSAAFLLLHIVLCIGPLCRLDPTFLPLLYNRRHLGVVTFVLGAIHSAAAIRQFHSLGDKDPLVSLLTSNQDFGSLPDFPFQQLGFLALMILFLMAATSHDYWLRNLTPPVWKTLHMLVYTAYALLVAHVTLGLLQSETNPLLAIGTAVGLLTVVTLHVAAARREAKVDSKKLGPVADGFVNACGVSGIPEKCATVVSVNGERVAIFKYDGKVSAISNVCRHQNGPLGEGKIIDGCVTCPWHGYQYLSENGASPPPFTEKVSTFQTRIVDGRVWIDPRPNPPGTRVEPSLIGTSEGDGMTEFYVGYLPKAPSGIARKMKVVIVVLFAAATTCAIGFAALQRTYARSFFESGKEQTFEGVIEAGPYPTLLSSPDAANTSTSRYLLVANGKHGADSQVDAYIGKRVRLRGRLIYRDDQKMIVLSDGSIVVLHDAQQNQVSPKSLGEFDLVGEIVDSKCYLGNMNPGNGKVHRDCAVRCLSGGIPPVFATNDFNGSPAVLLLTGPNQKPLPKEVFLDRVAQPMRIHGRVMQIGNTLLLETESSAIASRSFRRPPEQGR